jgi:phosphoribosylaminoimidazole-succinocarboxamide synthase
VTISKRYIELYEQVIGESFKPDQKTDEQTYDLICEALKKMGVE